MKLLVKSFTFVSVAALSFWAIQGSEAQTFSLDKSTTEHVVEGKFLSEPSGMVASRSMPGIFWTHTDSDGPSKVYAVRFRAGIDSAPRLIGAYDFGKNCNGRCRNIDFEDIGIGSGPARISSASASSALSNDWIYIADTGNNSQNRSRGGFKIIRFREPTIANYQSRVSIESANIPQSDIQTLIFQFRQGFYFDDGTYHGEIRPASQTDQRCLMVENPDYDVEAMSVHPISGDLYFLTKRFERGSRTVPNSFLYRVGAEELMNCKLPGSNDCWVPADAPKMGLADLSNFIINPRYLGKINRIPHRAVTLNRDSRAFSEVAEINSNDKVTGMDISPGGTMVAVLTYMSASIYRISGSTITASDFSTPVAVAHFNFPHSGRRLVPQAEALAFGPRQPGDTDSRDIFYTSEGTKKFWHASLVEH